MPVLSRRILIVDDEMQMRKFLRLSLEALGYTICEAATAEDALMRVHDSAPDLMILDLGLPDLDGRQVIRDVRQNTAHRNDLPILVLSGRTEDSEKIAVLEQGADDYITKPFAMQDLVQRIEAAFVQHVAESSTETVNDVTTGNLRINMRDAEVMRDRQAVRLEAGEYALLRLLAQHGGRVLTTSRIEKALWGQNDKTGTGHADELRNRIGSLRQKLERQPAFPSYIVTEPAVGYRLEMLPVTVSS